MRESESSKFDQLPLWTKEEEFPKSTCLHPQTVLKPTEAEYQEVTQEFKF